MVNANKIYALLGVPSQITPHLVTSPFFSPLVLGLIRLTLGVYALTTAIVILVHDTRGSKDASGYFSYFTELTYIGLTSYFWASGVQTLSYALRLRRASDSFPLQSWPRFLQFLHILLYSTITTFPILVTIVYWALLASAATFSTVFSSWSNISVHAFNTVFSLFEILLTHGGPNPWMHLIFTELILVGYLGVAYITHATEGFYTYSFLDPAKEHGLLAAYIVGIAAGGAIIFCLVKGIMILRDRAFARLPSPSSSDRGELVGDGKEELGEWEEVERPQELGV